MPALIPKILPPSDASPTREEALEHLEAVLASAEFAPSNRSKEFLRYVALQVLDGKADTIKERTIATEVFGKSGRYNPNEDSLVRVKASEVRKRLAKYYEASGLRSTVRMDLPTGSYAPRFRRVAHVPQRPEFTPADGRRKFLMAGAAGLAGIAGLSGGFKWWRASHRSSLQRFWAPAVGLEQPLVIFLPVLQVAGHPGQRSDRVGIGAATAAIRLVEYCSRSGHKYVVRVGDELSFADLRRQPAILLGNFISYWTAELNRDLRFVFEQTGGPSHILDTKTQQKWYAIGETPNGYATSDHALVTRVFDSKTGQILMLASGITTFGTQAAVDFLVDPNSFAQLVDKAPEDWPSKNFQALLSVRIMGASAGPPKLVASHFW